jgi:hypothetical protein
MRTRRGWALRTIRRGSTPQWRVSTVRARRHIADLRAAGLTLQSIANAAQLSIGTVHRVTRARHCSSLTAAAICAVSTAVDMSPTGDTGAICAVSAIADISP